VFKSRFSRSNVFVIASDCAVRYASNNRAKSPLVFETEDTNGVAVVVEGAIETVEDGAETDVRRTVAGCFNFVFVADDVDVEALWTAVAAAHAAAKLLPVVDGRRIFELLDGSLTDGRRLGLEEVLAVDTDGRRLVVADVVGAALTDG